MQERLGKRTWIAVATLELASPGATNEPDRSGLRVGPEPLNTVPKEGLEPSHPKAQEPKSCVSTSSTTPALFDCFAPLSADRALESAYFVLTRRR